MRRSSFLTTILISCLITLSANAAQLPRFLGTEKKFRSFIFNPNEVYRYVGHYTYQGFIEFAAEEKISTISMGDPTLWMFQHLGNRLFLKPVGENRSETNMTVITDKRIYHFELMAKEARNINDKDLVFVAKFIYPDDKDKNLVQFPRKSLSDEPDMRDLSIYNFNYQYTGEPSIAPLKVFDNKEFTYFQFPTKNAEIPAIFSVDASGFESLVNFRSAGDYIIVEKVAPQYTLRNGADIVCVYNMDLYTSGRSKNSSYNSSAAASPYAPMANSSPYSSGMDYSAPGNMMNMTSPSIPQMPGGMSGGMGGSPSMISIPQSETQNISSPSPMRSGPMGDLEGKMLEQ